MGNYSKRRISIGGAGWTPVAPPFACYAVIVRNVGPGRILLRTDADDANTEDEIESASQEIIRSPNWFLAGQTLCVLKAAEGTATVVYTFSG
jgi:hypothetical protein